MSMTLGQQSARLQELIQTITPAAAKRLINVAYLDNSQMHPWQHLLARFTLQTEPLYNTGTIAILHNTTTVTLSDGTWDTSWTTAPSQRRMSIAGRNEFYDVTTFGSTTTATLADNYPGNDLTDSPYFLYRDTYPLPTDCGYTKLMALYDPQQRSGERGRLWYYNQPRFIRERQSNPILTGIPWCFTLVNQTTENPPRPQMLLFPAPSEVIVYHGWYFKRPAIVTSDAGFFDWPTEFDDMHWLRAALDFYKSPQHYSNRMLATYKGDYADLFRKMKQEMDGRNAIDSEIRGTVSGPGVRYPMFYGSSASGSVKW